MIKIHWLIVEKNFSWNNWTNFNACLYREEDEAEDEVDSDFSIDENDEPVSENEEDGAKTVKRRLVTKAYKVCYIQSKNTYSFGLFMKFIIHKFFVFHLLLIMLLDCNLRCNPFQNNLLKVTFPTS